MKTRIQSVRFALVDLLNEITPFNWNFIKEQIGMFAFTCLSSEECVMLKEDYHVYITTDGRMSLSGLTKDNVEYVARAIANSIKGRSVEVDNKMPKFEEISNMRL